MYVLFSFYFFFALSFWLSLRLSICLFLSFSVGDRLLFPVFCGLVIFQSMDACLSIRFFQSFVFISICVYSSVKIYNSYLSVFHISIYLSVNLSIHQYLYIYLSNPRSLHLPLFIYSFYFILSFPFESGVRVSLESFPRQSVYLSCPSVFS